MSGRHAERASRLEAVGLSPRDKAVLVALAAHDGPGGAWPSIETIARMAWTSHSGAKRSLRALESAGLITREINAGGTDRTRGDRRPNRYVLHLDHPVESPARGITGDPPSDVHGGSESTPRGVTLDPHGGSRVTPEPVLEPVREPVRSSLSRRAPGHDPPDDERGTGKSIDELIVIAAKRRTQFASRVRNPKAYANAVARDIRAQWDQWPPWARELATNGAHPESVVMALEEDNPTLLEIEERVPAPPEIESAMGAMFRLPTDLEEA